MSPEEKELRNSIRKMLSEKFDDEDDDNLGIYSDYDEKEAFGGEAEKAAMADIEASGEDFIPLGKSKFEKNLDIDQMKKDLATSKLNLPSEKKKLNPLKKALDARFKQEKMFGKGSMNESYKIDETDPLFARLSELGMNPVAMPYGTLEIDFDSLYGQETVSFHLVQLTSNEGTENLYTANISSDNPYGGEIDVEKNVFFGNIEDAVKFAVDREKAIEAELDKLPKADFSGPSEPHVGPRIVGKLDLTGMDTKRFEEGAEETGVIPEKVLEFMYYAFGSHFGDPEEIEINAGDKYGVGKQMVKNVGTPSYNKTDKTMDIPVEFTYNEMNDRMTTFKVPYFVWKKIKEGTWKGKPQGRFTKSIELNEGHVNSETKIDRTKDAEGNPITLKCRVEHLKSRTLGRVERFVIGDDGKINVKVDWIQDSLMGMKLVPVVPTTDIVVRDETRVVREDDVDGAYMYKQNLNIIDDAAEVLKTKINDDNLEDWAEDKLSKVAENMRALRDFYSLGRPTSSEKDEELDEDSLAFRHKAGPREKNVPLGQHAPHSQAALKEGYDYSREELSHHHSMDAEKHPEWFVDDNNEVQVDTPDSVSKKYVYHINLDERGEFMADVRDENDETVFNIDGYDIFEDGFMKDKHDHEGLKKHLINLGIINLDDKLECAETGEITESEERKVDIDGIIYNQLNNSSADYTYMHPSEFSRDQINEAHKKMMNLVRENYASFDKDGNKNYYWLTDKGKKLSETELKKSMNEGFGKSEYRDSGFLRGNIEKDFS